MKKLFLNIISLLLIIPFGYSFFNEIGMFNIDISRNYMFLFGTIFFIILHLVISSKLQYFSTFEHEFTHSIWALFFFKKPRGFHVNTDGSGLFEWSGSAGLLSKVFILLSPYFFPTITMFLIILSLIIKDEFMSTYFLVIGLSFGYHIVSSIKEMHLGQTDITENGYFTSFNIITLMSLIMNGIVISFINNGLKGIGEFFTFTYLHGYNLVISIL